MAQITLDFAKEAFETFTNNETAGVYLMVLLEYHSDGMIGNATLEQGVRSVAMYLNPRFFEAPINEH